MAMLLGQSQDNEGLLAEPLEMDVFNPQGHQHPSFDLIVN